MKITLVIKVRDVRFSWATLYHVLRDIATFQVERRGVWDESVPEGVELSGSYSYTDKIGYSLKTEAL